jgi:uncharacterized protein YacL
MNYISLLNAAFITDLLVISLILFGYIQSNTLNTWYRKFGLAAFLSDTLILVIGYLIAQFIYPFLFKKYNLLYFLCVVVGVQLVHDLLFGLIVNQYKGKSDIINVFKNYIKEVGPIILAADAAMVLSTALLQKVLEPYKEANIVLLIVLTYLAPYFIYSV